ncbi:MAG: hypothetical protein OEV94_02195 [Deltaproteobacteria bacterium]|nr:hypothetical protein [Deltaproteobacteria bacterium]
MNKFTIKGIPFVKSLLDNPSSTNRKKPTSPEKIAANRLNAKKSTGPKTPRGKNISKMNAEQNGFFSEEAIIKHGFGKEDPKAFEQLRSAFYMDLAPQGAMEIYFVEEIVATVWRKRRVLKKETGDISAQADFLGFKKPSTPLLSIKKPNYFYDEENPTDSQSAQEAMDNLLQLKQQIESMGYVSSKEMLSFLETYNRINDQDFLSIGALNEGIQGKLEAIQKLFPEEKFTKDICKDKIKGQVDNLIQEQNKILQEANTKEEAYLLAQKMSALIPRNEELLKNMGYEMMMDKKIQSALKGLLQLQGSRFLRRDNTYDEAYSENEAK